MIALQPSLCKHIFGVKITKIYADNASNLASNSLSKFDNDMFYTSLQQIMKTNNIEKKIYPMKLKRKQLTIAIFPTANFETTVRLQSSS